MEHSRAPDKPRIVNLGVFYSTNQLIPYSASLERLISFDPLTVTSKPAYGNVISVESGPEAQRRFNPTVSILLFNGGSSQGSISNREQTALTTCIAIAGSDEVSVDAILSTSTNN